MPSLWVQNVLDLQDVVGTGELQAHSGAGAPIIGLTGLVQHVFGVGLNKAAQMSDWQARPLHPRQVGHPVAGSGVRVWRGA